MCKRQIFVVVLTENLPVKENRRARFDCARAKVPAIRRKDPSPAKRFAGADDVDRDRPAFHNPLIESNRSALDQIQAVRMFSSAKDHFASVEILLLGVTRQQFDVM